MTKKIVIILTLLSLSKNLLANEAPSLLWDGGMNSILATKNTFSITISDQVTGGCLPNPRDLKDKMEFSLRKNGFKIKNDKDAITDNIFITVLGYKTNQSTCIIHLSVDLRLITAVIVPFSNDGNGTTNTLTKMRYNIGNGLLSGSKNSMQSRLKKEISEYGDKLYLDISRAKDYTFSKFPFIKRNYQNSIIETK